MMNEKDGLLRKFLAFNAEKRMASSKKRTLLAVSGGIDSLVMCDLFFRAGFPFAIAHCNFQLRGKEADEDELLVKNLAEFYKVNFYNKRFNTASYSSEKGISIQLAARELRYEWFNELLIEHHFRLLATAHQLNDNIETLIFNLARGSGIRGLRGIPVRQGNIIRPLLNISREEILQYQQEHTLNFREDNSNIEDKYTRNKIRKHVIPLLKEINPALEDTVGRKIDLFAELEKLYERNVAKSVKQLFIPRGSEVFISIEGLKKAKNAATVLFEYLNRYGFNEAQVNDILHSFSSKPGKQFLSAQARIVKDRRFLILTKLVSNASSIYFIDLLQQKVLLNNSDALQVSFHSSTDTDVTKNKQIAFLDKAKLQFPLICRRWQKGDYFYPLGMGMKKKKLKKFFVDEKVPLHEKEKVWVVESDNKIVWIAGYRLDERFKVTNATTELVKLHLL